MTRELQLTRRGFAAALGAAGTLAVIGCSKAAKSQVLTVNADSGAGQMVVYRDPSCPCCEKWAALARDAGYQVRVVDHPDMPAIKRQYGVPDELTSCHTAIVGGYAIEGHVPFEPIERLLRERPAGVLGLAVAGMPAGSPGMEVPGGAREDFEVMAFARNGAATPFRS